VVTLEPLTDANRAEALALRVPPDQLRFVSSVEDSLREALEHPAAHASCWLIRADRVPVGFAMTAEDVDDPTEYFPNYLWKLLIDADHQRHGHGTAALALIADHFRARPGVTFLTVMAGQGPGSPIPFYERNGFVRTGEVYDDEAVLRLAL
jgi:GNAT superfamily N-acetyltransferase